MPKPRSTSSEDVLGKAMQVFWSRGYEATSMADLVAATGSTRHSIYSDFESKTGLYRACFDLYREQVVGPALTPFASGRGGLEAIADYFDIQISLAQESGLPGPGCLVGNAMTETAPNNPEILRLVKEHNARLGVAFAEALPDTMSPARRRKISELLVVTAQGLWAMSRVVETDHSLRRTAGTIVSLIEEEINQHG